MPEPNSNNEPKFVIFGKKPRPNGNGTINLHLKRMGLASTYLTIITLSILFFFLGVNLGSSGVYRVWVDYLVTCEKDSEPNKKIQLNCFIKDTLLKADASGDMGVGLADIKANMKENATTMDHLYSIYHDLNTSQSDIKQLKNEVMECKNTSAESLKNLEKILEIANMNCSGN